MNLLKQEDKRYHIDTSRKVFVYNSALKRYEKKLPNEKMMVFDVKTKKTSIL